MATALAALGLFALLRLNSSRLAARLESPRLEIRNHALQELGFAVREGRIRSIRPYLSALIDMLETETTSEHSLSRIIFVLQSEIPSEEARACLLSVLRRIAERYDELPTRVGLVSTVGSIASTEDDAAVQALCALLAADPSPIVRREAALALSGLVGPPNNKIVAAFEAGLRDSEAQVRVASALGAWSATGSHGLAIDTLLANLDNSDENVRHSAAGALSQLAYEVSRTHHQVDLCKRIQEALITRLTVEEEPNARFWMEEALRVIAAGKHEKR